MKPTYLWNHRVCGSERGFPDTPFSETRTAFKERLSAQDLQVAGEAAAPPSWLLQEDWGGRPQPGPGPDQGPHPTDSRIRPALLAAAQQEVAAGGAAEGFQCPQNKHHLTWTEQELSGQHKGGSRVTPQPSLAQAQHHSTWVLPWSPTAPRAPRRATALVWKDLWSEKAGLGPAFPAAA